MTLKTITHQSLTCIALIICAIVFAIPAAQADQNWDGDNAVGNFSFANNWYGDTVGGLSGFGFANGSLHFSQRNNGAQTSIFYDFAGYADTNDIFWDSTFGAGLTLNGNGQGLNFNQRLENNSSFTQTIGASMNLSGAKNGASQIELNPVNGDLVINGNIFNDNSKPYHVFGNNGKTLTVNTTLGVGGNAAAVTFTVEANSNVIFTKAQSYTGVTTITGGSITLGNGTTGNDGSIAGASIVNNSALNYNLFGSSTYGGSISGSGTVSKSGAGTIILTGSNSFAGTTTISAGVLEAGGAGALGSGTTGTSGISVANGATLRLSNSGTADHIKNTATISLAAGSTFSTGGVSEGTRPTGPLGSGGVVGMGALSLAGTSPAHITIDFGTNVNGSSLVFSSLASGASGLFIDILNWNGNAGFDNGATSNDRLLFATNPNLTEAQLANISFAGFAPGATEFIYGNMFEIVPVPEPGTWVAGGLMAASLLAGLRRRRAKLVRA